MPLKRFLPKKTFEKCCFFVPLKIGCTIIAVICLFNGTLLLAVKYYWNCTYSYVLLRDFYTVVIWMAGIAQAVSGGFLLAAIYWVKRKEFVIMFVIVQLVWCVVVIGYLVLYFCGLWVTDSRSPLDRPECPMTADNLAEVLFIVCGVLLFYYFAAVAKSYGDTLQGNINT